MREDVEDLAGSHHVHTLRRGAKAWNAWRHANPGLVPDLNRAALEHATLIEADLTDAVLVRADLSHARLERADLRGADLSNANLDDADLEGARLENAILRGAQLHYARNLTQAQIDRARGDRGTALPAHLTTPRRWLKDKAARTSQLEKRMSSQTADLKGDLYAALGVKRGASPREIRAAYLTLVKDLHPDGRFDDPAAGERLKAINRAYQDLKELERRAAARKAENGFLGRRSVLFAIGLLASTIPMLAIAGALYRAGYFTPGETRATGPEVESVRVTLAATPAPEQPIVPIEKSESADDAAWAEADREGTSVSLHRYLGRYPQGRHVQKAAEGVAVVAASEAVLDKSPDWRDRISAGADKRTLSRYLEIYPDGRFAAEVRIRVSVIDAAEGAWRADDTAWAEAERDATRAGIGRYLDAHPGGDHAAKARQALAALEAEEARRRAGQSAWVDAERAGTKEALRRYLDAYPDSDHAAAARQALAALEAIETRQRADRDAWADAERVATRAAVRGYLDAYPDGGSVAQARRVLALLEAAERQRLQDDLAWSEAQQRNNKASYAAYLRAQPDGRHANDARARIAELESLELKARDTANIKASGRAAPGARASSALGRMLWPSPDEPFIGADGRIRPH